MISHALNVQTKQLLMLFNEKHRLSWRLKLLLMLATSAYDYDYDYDYARSGGAGGARAHHPAPATLVVNRSSLDSRLDRAVAAYDAYSH